MNWKWFAAAALLAVAAISAPAVAGAGAERETLDLLNQGGAGVYATDAVVLTRATNGLHVKVRMPAPVPDTYVYPGGAVPGAPEVFTGWAFVFNHPELCTEICGADDLGAAPAHGGIYNFAGVIVGGSTVTLSGHISVGQTPAGAAALESPLTAEVHVAVAPHGQLDASDLPEELSSPAGSPICGCWWLAFFQ